MAVYTTVSREQLAAFLEHYDLGTLESYEGIEQGVSNSNYHLYTSTGHYILTLFEPRRVDQNHVPFFLAYATHLAECGIPSARAIKDKGGALMRMLQDRPTAIMSFLEGEHPTAESLSPDLCAKAGTLAAQMHKAGETFGLQSDNAYGFARWEEWTDALYDQLDDVSFGLGAIAKGEIAELKSLWPEPDELPKGAIHADLFPDNVLVENGEITGVIDFHFACTDFLVYDLAIIVNAWCFDEQAVFVKERYDAFMAGYTAERTLSQDEHMALPNMLRAAALRFVLSRCEETLNHKPDDLVAPHDPLAFIKRLKFFQDEMGAGVGAPKGGEVQCG